MRILALDVGSKRIGIAITDPTGTITRPLTTINRSNLNEEAKAIKEIVEEYEVDEVVAGLPIDLKGQHGLAAEKIQEYLGQLEPAIGIKIIPIDERLTTKMASQMLMDAGLKANKRKKVIDEMAATMILESYLESRKGRE